MRRLIAVASCLLICAAAPAPHVLSGVSLPEQVSVGGTSLTLNGLGLRTLTLLRIHGYVAALYVRTPSHEAAVLLDEPGPKLLEIHFVHAASRARVQGELRRGRAMNCAEGCPASDEASFNRLLATVRDVKSGDVSGYVLTAGGVDVLFNGQMVAHIPDADFAHRLLAGMIGAHPPQDQMRDGLLGR